MYSEPQLTSFQQYENPQGGLSLIENNIFYSTMGNKSGHSNTEQSSEVVVSDWESWLLSGMNQSRLAQSNLWQETTSLWDTPAVHLYAAQHHKQLNSGGYIYCSCQGRNMFPFYNFSGKDDHTNAPLFSPLLLTCLNLSPLSSAPVSFPSVHRLKGFPGDCVPLHPETAAQQSCTANVPSDTTQIHTLPRQAVREANGI